MLLAFLFLELAHAACIFDSSKDYYSGLKVYTPTHAESFRITYNKYFKLFNVTVSGKNYITTLSVCGAPVPSVASLNLGTSDVLRSQLSQPITAGITSTTYAPFFSVRPDSPFSQSALVYPLLPTNI